MTWRGVTWRSNEAARGSSGGNGLFGRPHGCSIMAAMLSGYDYRSSQTPSYAPSYAPSRPPSYATVESSARSIYTPGLTAFRAGPRRDPLSRETHVLSMAQTGRSMNLPTATGPFAKNTFGAGLAVGPTSSWEADLASHSARVPLMPAEDNGRHDGALGSGSAGAAHPHLGLFGASTLAGGGGGMGMGPPPNTSSHFSRNAAALTEEGKRQFMLSGERTRRGADQRWQRTNTIGLLPVGPPPMAAAPMAAPAAAPIAAAARHTPPFISANFSPRQFTPLSVAENWTPRLLSSSVPRPPATAVADVGYGLVASARPQSSSPFETPAQPIVQETPAAPVREPPRRVHWAASTMSARCR